MSNKTRRSLKQVWKVPKKCLFWPLFEPARAMLGWLGGLPRGFMVFHVCRLALPVIEKEASLPLRLG
jgi:hypothetical protein